MAALARSMLSACCCSFQQIVVYVFHSDANLKTARQQQPACMPCPPQGMCCMHVLTNGRHSYWLCMLKEGKWVFTVTTTTWKLTGVNNLDYISLGILFPHIPLPCLHAPLPRLPLIVLRTLALPLSHVHAHLSLLVLSISISFLLSQFLSWPVPTSTHPLSHLFPSLLTSLLSLLAIQLSLWSSQESTQISPAKNEHPNQGSTFQWNKYSGWEDNPLWPRLVNCLPKNSTQTQLAHSVTGHICWDSLIPCLPGDMKQIELFNKLFSWCYKHHLFLPTGLTPLILHRVETSQEFVSNPITSLNAYYPTASFASGVP